ncbi:MAG: hypothetical protein ACYCXF_00905 [Thermoleophilia bacterium]
MTQNECPLFTALFIALSILSLAVAVFSPAIANRRLRLNTGAIEQAVTMAGGQGVAGITTGFHAAEVQECVSVIDFETSAPSGYGPFEPAFNTANVDRRAGPGLGMSFGGIHDHDVCKIARNNHDLEQSLTKKPALTKKSDRDFRRPGE